MVMVSPGQAWLTRKRNRGEPRANAFIFGLIIVFLVLAAQFESWTLPGAVMTAVPFGILGALDLQLRFAVSKTMSTSRSACWC